MWKFDLIKAVPFEWPNAADYWSRVDLVDAYKRFEAAHAEVFADAAAWAKGDDVPPEKQPLDAGFIHLPERLLKELKQDKQESELAQVKRVATEIAGNVDKVVVLGIGGSYMGARALFEACCHPLHNELPRAKRRAPRLYFAGNGLDNDATSAVLDIVDDCQFQADDPADRYAVIVISKSGGTLETAVGFRLFLQDLQQKLGDRAHEYIYPITGESGRLREFSTALGCQDVFTIPDGVGGRFSIFTPVGLLPAAVVGIDPEELLRGAQAANDLFAIPAVPGKHALVDFVLAGRLWDECGVHTRVLSVWADGLEALGLWYDQLLAESLGKNGRGPTPITVVNTRDLHSRGQQHQEGSRDKFIINLVVKKFSAKPLKSPKSEYDQDHLNELAGKKLPTMLHAAIDGTNQAYEEVHRPTATITLPAKDAKSLGEFMQMMMLATVLEGRMMKINPYGQPGVEAYKKNMNANLRG